MMRSVSCIAFTKKGCALASRIASELREAGMDVAACGPKRFAAACGLEPFDSLDAWTKERFELDDALVFVGAAGIAVRAIAPHVHDKFSDPAVVQVDEAGAFAVALLSGHVGGANKLARDIARICRGRAVISTATDVNTAFAVDEWAQEHGLAICERTLAKRVSAAILDGTPVGFLSDFEVEGELAEGLLQAHGDSERPELGIHVTYDEDSRPFENTLHLVARNIVIGAGCKKGTDPAAFSERIMHVLAEKGVSMCAVKTLASIDVKREEVAFRSFARETGCGLAFFSADELSSQEGEFSHSDFVEAVVGVDNVCERAAMRACESGELMCGKRALDGVTVALAQDALCLSFENGKKALLSVVGLGPGGADDMTLRARRCIEQADLIVGYTVYVDLVKADFPEKQTFTTPMRKEVERCRAALEQAASGKRVALVCSGDPGVYGMAGLIFELAGEFEDVDIEVIPGVSAANGGAAVLGAALMHDYAVVSLSDLLTPWARIEKRLRAAAAGDFVICLYNPSSHKRTDYLRHACDILLELKPPETVCGFARNIGRDGEESHITTLGELRNAEVDMFTTVFIGNSQTKMIDGRMVTPRGYVTRGEALVHEDAPRPNTFLVFGGTTEGRELAMWLSERKSCELIVSSATEYGGSLVEGLPHVQSRVGRMPEPEIEQFIASNGITCVIDATHPYADSISASAKRACDATGTPYMRVVREDEARGLWISCADAEAAARYLAGREGNILLTTGSKELQTFVDAISLPDERLFVRILPVPESVERVRGLGIPPSHVIAMQGPFSKELNCALIREYNIDILVTKASGSIGGFEDKAAAAQECGIELVVIERPCSEEGLSLEEAKRRLESRYGA